MLVSSYNDLLLQIDIYLAEMETAYATCRKDELHLLQMQINPHFLYNTLGGIKNLVAMNDPHCLDYQIPNLLLQPLIENAFFHAFQNTKSGHIRIYIAQKQEALCYEVTDNGDGMSPEQLDKLLSGHTDRKSSVTHIGLWNVRKRLQMLYGDKHSFRITSELDYGTHIQIQMPARRASTSIR